MLDNFRKRDFARPGSPRTPQSPGSEPEPAAPHPPALAAALDPQPPVRPSTPGAAAPEARPRRVPGDSSQCRLVVGPDVQLRGAEITACDTLVVEGRVEASMESRSIEIAEHGEFVGTAGIETAEVRGRFDGELTARVQLVIRATGRVTGRIRYGKVTIEEGGELTGEVAKLGAGERTADAKPGGEATTPAGPVVSAAHAGHGHALSQPARAVPGTPR